MEAPLAIVIGLFFAASVFLLASGNIIRIFLGVALLGSGANLMIFGAGRIMREVPPVIPEGLMAPLVQTANPLPQALILTAIVISFSLFAFVLVLVYRAYQELGTEAPREMRLAEPVKPQLPPEGY
jgi:multicomponent Na+:H+ antiporter subunit C